MKTTNMIKEILLKKKMLYEFVLLGVDFSSLKIFG